MPDNRDFNLLSLRGGYNDTDPPSALAEDACTLAENVEFVDSTLGERRAGCDAISLPASFSGLDAVTWLSRHLPTSDEGVAQLWALAQDLSGATPTSQLAYRNQTVWNNVTPVDAIDATVPQGHQISAVSLHGKKFITHKSNKDRLHVWDGTTLRRTGLTEPAAPTVANQGSGTLTGLRYYRVRYAVQIASVTVLRSEPSDVASITPSGSGASVRVTKPATINESETHWEVEASLDNANFYRIATVAVGTTTSDDSTAYTTGYAVTYPLSDDIGDYSLIPSGKFLSVDNDRLIIGGSWDDPAQGSRLRWTPVFGGPGVGNDERLEEDTDPFIDLDGYEGGELTGLSRAVNGYLFAFKWSHIYKVVRTGQRANAYEAVPMTKAKGALPGSLIEAIDQAGQPAQYFLDPKTGPMRIGSSGLQSCSRDIQNLWQRVNVDALVKCHGIYDDVKRQVHWWLTLDDSDYPNAKIVVHVNEMRNTDEGARRGWVTVPVGDDIAAAHCSVMFAPNIDSTDPRELTLRPFIGKEDVDSIQLCDTGSTDNGTTYRGTVRSKPFILAGLLNQHEIKQAALLARASSVGADRVFVRAIRDFGAETITVDTDLLPTATEQHVIKQLDDLSFSELYAVQIELGDLDGDVEPPATWELNGLALKTVRGQSA